MNTSVRVIIIILLVGITVYLYRFLRNTIKRKKIEKILGTKFEMSNEQVIEMGKNFGIFDEEDEEDDIQFVYFEKDLPFTPSRYQIIYVEDEYNVEVNDYIKNNFDRITSLLEERGYQFCYLPFISAPDQDVLNYYYPDLEYKIVNNKIPYQDLFRYTTRKRFLQSGFLCYYDESYEYGEYDDDDWQYEFAYLQLDLFPELSIEELLVYYIEEKSYRPSKDLISRPPRDEYADYCFDCAAQNLIEEVKERVEKLKLLGVSEAFLKSLVIGSPKLSRLVITKDYNILLPDYNNKEIVLYPLVKAVFFLFLKHPEGILFKHLPDHERELTDIYLKISNRENVDNILESIKQVVDPTKNSINEKCSRVREAFIKEFDESLSRYYFITGERGMPKKIMLDREFITWETEI